MKMLEKVIEFANENFKAQDKSIEHYERAMHWTRKLKPDADEAILIAAYAHDIDRAFSKEGVETYKDKELTELVYRTKHAKACAKIIADFLKKQNYPEENIKRVSEMVRYHEEGGTPESDLIKDADSLSYFEVNAPKHVKKFKILGKDKIKNKFDFMFNRISSQKAKKIAEPMYRKAVLLLEKEFK